ncbi:DUF4962 domain-containing protein [Janthinobacterium sp. LB3P118]|uniref:DUF4962 domain-containing protein n=1 Tax=Janthinobacterium sp. LB3P118 TaxID=3424195 RepID=UPI003F1F5660
MIHKKSFFSVGIALTMSVFSGPGRADWAETTDLSVVRPAPVDRQIQAQNPPAFAWSRYPSATKPPSYTLEVQKNGATVATFTSTSNVYLPSKAFAAGEYTWRVRPSTKADWSTPRSFTIDSSSQLFEVPEAATIKARILAHARPRQQASTFLPRSKWTQAMITARGPALTRLSSYVSSQIVGQQYALAAPSDAKWPLTSTLPSATRTLYINQISQSVGDVGNQTLGAAVLYRITGESKYLQEALTRGDQLAALSPAGMTSYVNHDIGSNNITMALAKTADLLYAELAKDGARKARWMASINARFGALYADLSSDDGRLDYQPYDSHGTEARGFLALVSTLTIGDIPAADKWFDFSFRPYVNSISVWSGPEGGFSNGSAYGMYSADNMLQMWQPMAEITGVNIFDKPWAAGFSRYLMQFVPPGAPGHVFGDAHEEEMYNFVLKGFSSRIKSANAAWYAKNIPGDEDDLTLLQAPYPLPVQTVTEAPLPPPNAALYPSIGWVAMHSNLSDLKRTSVYFKSSPYGSYNHSHGDQNSLVIDSGGRRLLIESGYQDYFYSPLGLSWYRQTKAKNAITFNKGVGQIIDQNTQNLAMNGKITAFSTTPALDYAAGDATPAYGGALSSAVRKVWYLRGQDAVVVVDKLSAPTALSFEWNLHAGGPILKESATAVKISKVDRTLCISSLGTEKNGYQVRTGPPPKEGTTEDHGAFVKTVTAKSAEFIVLLDVGCKRPKTTLTSTQTGRVLTVGAQTITIPN